MALSAAVDRTTRPAREMSPEIVDAQQLYRGGFCAVATINHATTANRGRAVPYASSKNLFLVGMSDNSPLGDTSPLANFENTRARLNVDGNVEYKVAITGLAGDVSDVTRVVYLTDDGTFTLTPAALATPLGPITQYVDSSDAWFRLFNAMDLVQFCNSKDTINLGLVSLVIASATDTEVKTGITVPYHCQVDSVFGFMTVALNTTATSVTVQPRIHNGTTATALTGGAMTVTTAYAVRAYVTATAVTDANVAHEGETFQVAATATTTAPTAGEIEVHMVIRALLGT